MELRLSYASEDGDRLSDLGDGKVLIRNPNKPDRILDRKTGEITERPYSEYKNLIRDFCMVVIPAGICVAAWFWLKS